VKLRDFLLKEIYGKPNFPPFILCLSRSGSFGKRDCGAGIISTRAACAVKETEEKRYMVWRYGRDRWCQKSLTTFATVIVLSSNRAIMGFKHQ